MLDVSGAPGRVGTQDSHAPWWVPFPWLYFPGLEWPETLRNGEGGLLSGDKGISFDVQGTGKILP